MQPTIKNLQPLTTSLLTYLSQLLTRTIPHNVLHLLKKRRKAPQQRTFLWTFNSTQTTVKILRSCPSQKDFNRQHQLRTQSSRNVSPNVSESSCQSPKNNKSSHENLNMRRQQALNPRKRRGTALTRWTSMKLSKASLRARWSRMSHQLKRMKVARQTTHITLKRVKRSKRGLSKWWRRCLKQRRSILSRRRLLSLDLTWICIILGL